MGIINKIKSIFNKRICPKCGSEMKEKGYNSMKCVSCGFEKYYVNGNQASSGRKL